jgi:lantibiotic modifying enzyme
VYTYAHLSALWDDAELRAQAAAVLAPMVAHVAHDNQLDVIGGAGIACGLLEIAELTDEARFAQAAERAFEYERSLFSAEHGNWPDLRPYAAGEFAMAWCHGAPGIGLARLRALSHLSEPALARELEVALGTTVAHGFGGNHTLCHGDLGNADILLSASERTHDPQWAAQAQRAGARVLDRARAAGGFICGNPLGVESPGLMTGLAGIGYGLLRLAAPAQVPSVLGLEAPRKI